MATASDSSGNSTPSSQGPGSPAASPPASPASGSQSTMPSSTKSGSPSGPKFKLIHEGDIQVCRLNHTRTIVSKIMNSKYLRRWEAHHLILADSEILSSTVSCKFVHRFIFSHIWFISIKSSACSRQFLSFNGGKGTCRPFRARFCFCISTCCRVFISGCEQACMTCETDPLRKRCAP